MENVKKHPIGRWGVSDSVKGLNSDDVVEYLLKAHAEIFRTEVYGQLVQDSAHIAAGNKSDADADSTQQKGDTGNYADYFPCFTH